MIKIIIIIIIITIIRAQDNRGVRNGSHRSTWTWRLKYRIIRKVLDMKKEKKKKKKEKPQYPVQQVGVCYCGIFYQEVISDLGLKKNVLMSPTTPVFFFFMFELVKYCGINGVFLVFLIGAPINHINILKILSCFQYSNISVLHFSFCKCNGFSYKEVENLWLKVSFFFTKNQTLFIFSFHKIEKNVDTVYDYPHDAYYRS